MAEVTSITRRGLSGSPAFEKKVFFYTYTKDAAGDTLDVTGEFQNVDMVLCTTAVGTADTASESSETITFVTGTGAGAAVVIGD